MVACTLLLFGANACSLDTMPNGVTIDDEDPRANLLITEGSGIRSLRANVSRTVRFTDPNGAVNNDVVQYGLVKEMQPDGSWETVITPAPRAPLFGDPIEYARTARQITEIRYADGAPPTMTYNDGTKVPLPQRGDASAVSIGPVRGTKLKNPVFDEIQPPQLSPGSLTRGPSLSTAASGAVTLDRLKKDFGEPTKVSSHVLEFTRLAGSKATKIIFDESVAAIVEQHVTDAGRLVLHKLRKSDPESSSPATFSFRYPCLVAGPGWM